MKITTRTDAIKIKGVKYYQGKRLFDAGLLKEDQLVNLCPEPENPHDSNAVAVKTISDEMLGHVSRRIAAKYQALAIYDQVHSSKIKSISVVSGYEVLDIRVLVTYSHVSHEYEYEIPITPGVYEIKLGSDFSYIGSTKNLKKRCSQHLSQLNSNIHVNKNIQNDFNKYGLDSFQFSILETTNDHDTALKLEEKIINEYFHCGKKLYNKTLDGRGISNPREPSKNNNGNLIDRKNLTEDTQKKTIYLAKYFGEILNGKPHGFGIFHFKYGDIYKGDVENIQMTEITNLIQKDGNVYVFFDSDNFLLEAKYQCSGGSFFEGSPSFGWFSNKNTENIDQSGRILILGRIDVDGNVHDEEFEDRLLSGNGKLTKKNGDIYEGEFVDGQFSKGKLTTELGNIYEGKFDEWVIYGEGKHSDADGNFYQGEFKDWVLDGSGQHIDSEGNTFTGNFKEGYLSYGKKTSPSGEIYEGNFLSWDFFGDGILKNEDGIYEGLFIDKEFISGKYIDNAGNIFEGDSDNWTKITKKDGVVIEFNLDDRKCKCISACGDVFEDYIDVVYEETAVLNAENGECYVGIIKNGIFSQPPSLIALYEYLMEYKWHDYSIIDTLKNGKLLKSNEGFSGKAKLTFPNLQCNAEDQEKFEGEFLNGEFIKGKYVDEAGEVFFEGHFKDMELHGKGKITYKFDEDTSVYDGEFVNGRFLKGSYIDEYETIHEGEFENWLLNGKGKVTYKDGSVYEGFFIDGNLDKVEQL
jgi:group I intron endonuclease